MLCLGARHAVAYAAANRSCCTIPLYSVSGQETGRVKSQFARTSISARRCRWVRGLHESRDRVAVMAAAMTATPNVCLDDFERHAARVLPKYAYDYYRSGADDQVTLRDNVEAFRRFESMLIMHRLKAKRERQVQLVSRCIHR